MFTFITTATEFADNVYEQYWGIFLHVLSAILVLAITALVVIYLRDLNTIKLVIRYLIIFIAFSIFMWYFWDIYLYKIPILWSFGDIKKTFIVVFTVPDPVATAVWNYVSPILFTLTPPEYTLFPPFF